MPNSRKTVILGLALLGLIVLLATPGGRRGVWGIATALWGSLLIVLIGFAGWTALEVWIGAQLSLWSTALVTSTAFWFVTTGLVLLFNAHQMDDRPGFAGRTLIETLAATALLNAYLDLAPLHVVAEAFLQPLLILLGGMLALDTARSQATYALGAIGTFLVVWSTLVVLASDDKHALALEFALPFWLSVGALPFILFAGVFIAYETIACRLRHTGVNRVTQLKAFASLARQVHVRVHRLSGFSPQWIGELADQASAAGRRLVIDRYLTGGRS